MPIFSNPDNPFFSSMIHFVLVEKKQVKSSKIWILQIIESLLLAYIVVAEYHNWKNYRLSI
jgi:hypothetical protein